MPQKKNAVILLSGGLDSATSGAWAIQKGFRLHALTLHYGQLHFVEIQSAKRVAKMLGVEDHIVMEVDLGRFGQSALTDKKVKVPKGRSVKRMGKDIPVTYVPARNTVFLSLALGLAEARKASDIIIGANVMDYSGYPDCRPEYLRAFEKMANKGTKAGSTGNPFKIHAPLLKLTKAKIIKLGNKLGVDYGKTHSCYDPIAKKKSGKTKWFACGSCDSCLLRKNGFVDAKVEDPTPYSS